MLKNNRNHHKDFNRPETLLAISLYPKKGETYSSGTTGVASYSKNVFVHLNRPIVVLADIIKKPQTYVEKNTLVVRTFTPGHNRLWLQLLASINSFSKVKTILIQYDFSMYGAFITSGLVIPFIALLRLMGKDVHLVSHHVVTDVNKLAGHMGLSTSIFDRVKAMMLNGGFFLFYLMLGWFANSIIVLEKTLEDKLQGIVDHKKVVTVPHAVDTNLRRINRREARKLLGIPQKQQVVLFFGFANWFKGADFFAEAFQNYSKLLGRDTQFIIAGGESATLKKQPYYQTYFKNILKTVYNSKKVTITGYVPQEKIKQYFSAADIVIFPYRHFMCASGVMSLVFSYRVPFIISSNISHMLDAEDFQAALAAGDLTKEQMSFELERTSVVKLTEKVLRNGLKKKLMKMGSYMRDQRSFKKTAALYDQALFSAATHTKVQPTLGVAK
ncbi:MAG: hypothetical protein QG639_337 [Patescibacteria group bacterium]|nr:hypothetical protein [Patescibacteria group bacterium]